MGNRRRKTARKVKLRGGVRPDIKDIMDNTPMSPNLTVNPNSKFVVVTYWWGGSNKNKNTQRPCIGDLQEEIKEELVDELNDENDGDADFIEMSEERKRLRTELQRDPTNESVNTKLREVNKRRQEYLNNYFNKDNIKNIINTRPNDMFKNARNQGKGHRGQ